jgi:hypothetical protein
MEAERIVNGERAESYGNANRNFDNIAKVWSIILGCPVTARQMSLCMVGLKLCREANSHKRDNLVDLAGYAHLAEVVGE